MDKLVVVNPVQYGIEEEKANDLLGNLPQIKQERDALLPQYSEIIQMDLEDPLTAKRARELRLLVKDNRTKGILVWHKTTKEFFLKGGQFIDAIKNKEIAENERMEEALEEIEKYAEIKQQKRQEALSTVRLDMLKEYIEFVPSGINFGKIDEPEFQKILNGSKMQYEAKVESERKAKEEQERIEKIKQLHSDRKELAIPYYQFWSEFERTLNFGEQSESDFSNFLDRIKKAKEEFDKQQELIRAENDKLRVEKEKTEKEALRIKKENEDKLKLEKEKAEKLRKELDQKKEAERIENERKEAELEKQRKESESLAKEPIKRQLNFWIDSFTHGLPPVENNQTKDILSKFESFKVWAKKEIEKL